MRPIVFLILAGVCPAVNAAGPTDPKAVEIAEAMMNAMGGREAWSRAPIIRYDFRVNAGGKTVVDRAHLWEKNGGRYRLESTTKEGARQVALFDTASHLKSGQGSVYVNGKKLEGSVAAAALKQAYGAYVNDMYWLAMPWKWMDSGVHLKYLGKRKLNAQEFDVVELTFDRVGLTPGDRYEAFVSPKSRLMEHWEYTLQNGSKGSWDWEYTTTEGIKLASNHTSPDRSIHMGNPRVLKSVDAAYFTDPARALSGLK